jgi:hypothetical protein
MKNIKEKAEETYPKTTAASDLCNEKFVEGANYVLDAIQSCIDRHEDGCLALEAIILTIDELKKK